MPTIKPQKLIQKEEFLSEKISDLQAVLSKYEDGEIFDSLQGMFQGLVVHEDGTIHFARTNIPHESFLSVWVIAHTCQSLKKLNLSKRNLSILPRNFANLVNLEHLDLSNNRFSQIPPVVRTLPSLSNLAVNGNPLTINKIEFSSSIHLDARETNLEAIPSGVRALTIYGQQLEALLPELASSSVTSITIEDFQRLPPYQGLLDNIKEFIVRNALIKNLPPILNQCPNLSHLSWEHGHLVQWPDNIHLPKLTQLSLRHNRIAWLSGNLRRHSSLRTLDLSYNNLRFIPQSVQACAQLTSLSLSNCQITKIDTPLRNLTNLKALDISGNPLKSLSPTLASMNLDSIDIKDTQIEEPHRLSAFVHGYDIEEDRLITPLIINAEHITKALRTQNLISAPQKTPIKELDLTGQSLEDTQGFVQILQNARPSILRLWKTKLPKQIPDSCPRPSIIYAETKDFLRLPESWHHLVVPPRFFSVHIESRFRESTFRSLLIQIHPDVFAHGYEIPQYISLPHGKEQYYLDLFSEHEILLTEIDTI